MKKHMMALGFVAVLLTSGSYESRQEVDLWKGQKVKAVSFKGIVSKSGIIAVPINHEADQMFTLLIKEGTMIGDMIEGYPMSWSPTEDVLLMAEFREPCDTRAFLLDIGGGEYQKMGDREAWALGVSRPIESRWSSDGKKVTVLGEYSSRGVTFTVDNYVRRYATHVVERGDTLFSLAQQFNTTVEYIKTNNNLQDSRIVVGQSLKIFTDRK